MESPLYGTPPSPPPIEEEVDLHVLVVPPYSWRRDLRLAYSVVCAESVSAGFIRVSKQALLSELRQCIEKQLETLLLPSQFVLLRNVGRCLTWVSYKQEHCLTASIYAPLNIRTGELYIIDSDYVTENVPFLRNKESYPLELSGTSLSPFPPVSNKSHEISQPYNSTFLKYSTLHAPQPDSPNRTNYNYRRASLPQIHLTSTNDLLRVTPTISTYSSTNQSRYSNLETISGYHDDKYLSPGNVATNESSQSDHNAFRLKTDLNIVTHSKEKIDESSKAEFIENLTDFKTELAQSSASISSQSLQNLDRSDKKITDSNEQHNPIVQVNISLSDPEVVATTAKLEQTLFPKEDKNTTKVVDKTPLIPQSPLKSIEKSSDVTAPTSSEEKCSNDTQEDKVSPVKKNLLKPSQQKTKIPAHVEREHVKVSKKIESKSSEHQPNNKKHLPPKITEKETSQRKDHDVVNTNRITTNNNGTNEEIKKVGSRDLEVRSEQPEVQESPKKTPKITKKETSQRKDHDVVNTNRITTNNNGTNEEIKKVGSRDLEVRSKQPEVQESPKKTPKITKKETSQRKDHDVVNTNRITTNNNGTSEEIKKVGSRDLEVVNERSKQPEVQESKKTKERNKDYDDKVARLLKEIETVKNECSKMSTTTGHMTMKIRKAQMSMKKQRENVDLEWKRRFFQEKQRSSQLEDQISVCKGNIDVLKSFVRANHHKQGGFIVSSGEKPSEIENYKRQCRQVELDIEELKERLAKTRKHLAIEQKVRQNATREHRLLKQELLEKQIEFTRTHTTKNLFT